MSEQKNNAEGNWEKYFVEIQRLLLERIYFFAGRVGRKNFSSVFGRIFAGERNFVHIRTLQIERCMVLVGFDSIEEFILHKEKIQTETREHKFKKILEEMENVPNGQI